MALLSKTDLSRVLNIILALFLLLSCSRDYVVDTPATGRAAGPVKVGLYIDESSQDIIYTKTYATEDGLSSIWEAGDKLAVWAIDVGGGAALGAVPFSLYASDRGKAFFSATLPEAMPSGTYTYYAAYPLPKSVSGTNVSYTLSDVQDGISSGGEDIMVSAAAIGGPLEAIDWKLYGHEEVHLSMDHLLHRLRFYTEAADELGGEPVRRIVASFPKAVTGDISFDVTRPSAAVVSATGATVTIEPETPVAISGADDRHYLTASIFPTAFAESDVMTVALYTDTKVARCSIPLRGRTFAAGHSTPVKIVPQSVGSHYQISLNLASNNLGEDIQTITLSAPSGCKWGDNLTNVYTYSPGREFSAGESFVLEYEDQAAFRSLSGKEVTVTYDSQHVTISETIKVESLVGKNSTSLALNVPYLLYEDFSTVGSFSYDDQYSSGFNTGSKDPHSFLNGWTGARIGASAGQSIRIACRRETSADYPARVDAAPLSGTIKSPVNLSVEFDYGANNQFGGISIITNPDVGQTCYVGYVTSTQGYKSGATDGTFESGNSFYVKEYSGSYTSTPNTAQYTIHNVPAGGVFRLTIRTEIEHQAGTNNTTAWLYIDNVKIKIAK